MFAALPRCEICWATAYQHAGPTLAANSDALIGVVSASEFSKFRPAQLNPAGLVDMGVIAYTRTLEI